MSKSWDKTTPGIEIWKEALRIVKPGGYLLSFGGTRTYHRITCAIEDAGWEIRDCLMWIYGQGFPKSHNHFGLEGYGTALKPAHEPIIVGQKPYELNHLIAIISYDLTNEIHRNICQRSNYNVSDAESNLKDSLALLSKELPFTVPENVKIYAWEKCADANYVAKNITGLRRDSSAWKSSFAQENVNTNGCAGNPLDALILHGGVEAIFANIQDIYMSVITMDTSENIALLWKNTLENVLREMNRFTTKMVLRLITELRTLKSCLSPTISNDTGNLYPNYEPIIMAMKPCDGTFAQNAEKWGQAGINIDGCRISSDGGTKKGNYPKEKSAGIYRDGINGACDIIPLNEGRWPANVMFDEFFEQILVLKDSLQNDIISVIQEYFHDYKLPNLPKRNKHISEPNQKKQGAVLQSSLLQSCADRKSERGSSSHEGKETSTGINCSNEETPDQDGKRQSSLQGLLVRERIQVHQSPRIAARASENSKENDNEAGHSRTPNYDGSLFESSIEKIGDCSSSQRSEGRQQNREFGSDGQLNSQNGTHGDFEGIESIEIRERTLKVLACDVPEKWLKYFELTGEEIRSPHCAAEMLDEQSGITTSTGGRSGNAKAYGGNWNPEFYGGKKPGLGDSGGASRFFYCAKASSKERGDGNKHPTVKPLKLMQYLLKLVAPPSDALILDPFAGSGTTVLAAKQLNIPCIGIERSSDYSTIARARINSLI